tara:strand:+ start:1003 stop:2634 length:1632 start_codon:yes stop_codon:yes gene_type:complete
MNFVRRKWALYAFFVGLAVSLPVLVLVFFWFVPAVEWPHIVDHLLGEYVLNSIILIFGVSLLAASIGTTTAWLVTAFNFPGKIWLQWTLVIPLSFPTYILSFVYVDLLSFTGPLQSGLRSIFGWNSLRDYYFPDIMSLPGAILLFSLVLYPYVYLVVRPVFSNHSHQLHEVSRTFGYSPGVSFFRISLPLARPAIVAGTSLALMETLNDFGTVSYFGIPTFTTGIYRAWGFLDINSAARLSTLLMLFIIALYVTESWQRKNHVFTSRQLKRNGEVRQLCGVKSWLALTFCFLPVALGFIVPLSKIILWSVEHYSTVDHSDLFLLMRNTFTVGLFVSLLIVLVALILTVAKRFDSSSLVKWFIQFATMGYAIPGSVIAIGILIPLGFIDSVIDEYFRANFNYSTGLLLSGTLFAVSYGYIVRFIMIAYNSVSSRFGDIDESLDEVASTLGNSTLSTFIHVHLPLIKSSLLSAYILVFIDVVKELPATLILRPFNFDTLATKTYEYAIEEMLSESAIYCLAIIFTTLLPTYLLSKISLGKDSSNF